MQTLLAACGPSLRKLTIESSIIDEQDHLDLAYGVKNLPLKEISLIRTWPSTFCAWTCGPVALKTFYVQQVEEPELDIAPVNPKSDVGTLALVSLSAGDIRCSKACTMLHQLAELSSPSLTKYALSDIDFWPRPVGGFSKRAWPSLKSLCLSSYTSTAIISILEQTRVLETLEWHCEPNAVESDLQSSMAALAAMPVTVQDLSIFGLQPVKQELAEAAISLLGRLHNLKRLGALTWAYDKAAAPESDEDEGYDSDAEVGPSPFPELRNVIALDIGKRGLPHPRSENEGSDLLFTWIPDW